MLPLFCLLLTEIRFEPSLRLQPPEEAGVFIQNPRSAAYHRASGKTFVLDPSAKCVYVWDREGRFLEAFGEPGEGPGQLALESQGFLTIVGDRVLVYDGMLNKLHSFDTDGEFVKTVRFTGHVGQDRYFRATASGHLLISKLDAFGSEQPTVRTGIYDTALEKVTDLPSFVDLTWVSRVVEGSHGWLWNPTAETLVLYTDTHSNEIIFGRGEPWFDVYDLEGKRLRRITFDLPRREVAPEEHSTFDERVTTTPTIRSRVRSEFHPRYNLILPHGDRGYIIGLYTGDFRLKGIYIDREGKTLGTVALAFGQLGGIDSLEGRLVRSIVTEEGDFDCAYVRPVFPKE